MWDLFHAKKNPIVRAGIDPGPLDHGPYLFYVCSPKTQSMTVYCQSK